MMGAMPHADDAFRLVVLSPSAQDAAHAASSWARAGTLPDAAGSTSADGAAAAAVTGAGGDAGAGERHGGLAGQPPTPVPAPEGLSAVAVPVSLGHVGAVRTALRAGVSETLAAAVVPSCLGGAPGVLVTDVDSTLIQQEVIELIAAHAGREAEVAAVTERAMRGELDFAASLHARVRALTGLPVRVLDEVAESVLPTPGAQALIDAAHAHGWRVGAVSGGFTQVLEPLAARLGLDHARANVLGVRDGVLTGTVEGPVIDRPAKASALRQWTAAAGVEQHASVGLGDGANDLDLLAAAGMGVGVRPKPVLRDAADGVLGLARLDAVAAFLGFLRSE